MEPIIEELKPAGSTWTDDQWRAIVGGGRNMLVAAAAGSGKTAVLVERIIRKISRDTDVDRLLVATFTKAAASEMKERIRIALEKALDANPDSDHLRRQLALMNRASITTLHSFCLDVIRRFYPLIGLDPGFRIAGETEAELLRIETMDDLFEERYADAGAGGDFVLLADAFGGERGDEPLAKLVHELYDFSRSHPWPELWLREAAAAFDVPDAGALEQSEWVRCLKGDVRLALEGAAALLEQAMEAARKPGGPAAYVDTLAGDLAEVRKLLRTVREEPWTACSAVFQSAAFGKLKPVKGDDVDKALQERVKTLREQAKDAVSALGEELFRRTPDEFAAEMRELAPLMGALAELVIGFGERYEAAKRRKGLLDFGDLEHYCLRILRDPASTAEAAVPSAAAEEYRRQFDEILLDEYQDTNMVQEAIVELISRPGPGNRFMVGDVKQSIYRFRLAEPNLFLAKYKAYGGGGAGNIGNIGNIGSIGDGVGDGGQGAEGAGAGDGAAGVCAESGGDAREGIGSDRAALRDGAGDGAERQQGMRIDLARNFRSRAEVVNGVNDVFRSIMHEAVAEMTYDRSAELVCGARYPAADAAAGDRFEVECALIDRGSSAVAEDRAEDDADDGEEAADRSAAAEAAADMQTAQLEARWIARRIRTLMEGNSGGEKPFRVYDGRLGAYRKPAWRDIVILLRATQQWAPILVEELQAHGIPAYAELNTGYFEATEVEIMLSLLRVIDNPFQDIPLAGSLRSPIFGLTAEELAKIRVYAGDGSYYEAVRKAADDLLVEEGIRGKLASFLDRLERWRNEARQGSLAELLWGICRETGFYDFVGGLPGGVQRQANLRALHDRARQYEATSFRGLFRFLRFIERMRDSGGDLGTARALGEQEDVVRIMSIHKSKGLEFPVVFVAGLGKTFNMQDLNGPFLLHKQLGFGPRLVDAGLRVSYPTLPYLAVRRRMRMETLAEEMRVLYVAMTRPKEKMFLLGTVADADKAVDRWSGVAEAVATAGRLPDHQAASARRFLDWIMPLVVRRGAPLQQSIGEAAETVNAGGDGADNDDGYGGGQDDGHGDVHGEAAAVKGWRFGVAPAALLGVEAAATSEPDKSAEAAIRERLGAIEAAVPLPGTPAAGTVEERLSWRYPLQAATAVAAKTSVTEMKRIIAEAQHEADAERYEEAVTEWTSANRPPLAGSRSSPGDGSYTFRLRRPRFMERKALTAAEKGTVSHLVMQSIPVGGPKDEESIRAFVEGMVGRLLLTPAQAEAVDTASIAAFFAGELGSRLAGAMWVKRELPFSCTLPAGRVHRAAAADPSVSGEPVFIQGVVDCLFEDERGLVLLDYKTDRIYMKDWEQTAERHRFQLELYAEAVGRILGRPVTECHVFFFDGGQSVRLCPYPSE
ncbi:UvrD-helicase domain-containing protein [uncultured Paenibacillus sp.]|uniref:UvrD-helicase domain-containing protein n=1 Tax=uncultured Paenibacillus sp. TaxID=227322 RepID=UPI0028D45187|nr:UvrD-helicase domain-containing protein [uncultured Paenibacillus sp.]